MVKSKYKRHLFQVGHYRPSLEVCGQVHVLTPLHSTSWDCHTVHCDDVSRELCARMERENAFTLSNSLKIRTTSDYQLKCLVQFPTLSRHIGTVSDIYLWMSYSISKCRFVYCKLLWSSLLIFFDDCQKTKTTEQSCTQPITEA